MHLHGGLLRVVSAAVGSLLMVLASAQEPNETLADELYQEFRSYRISISQEDRAPTEHFARLMLEDLLSFVHRDPNFRDENVAEAIRETLFFGLGVQSVYEYSAFADSDARLEVLRLVCACSSFQAGFGAIEIGYTSDEQGNKLIQTILFDTSVQSVPDDRLREPLDEFEEGAI